MPQLNPQSVSRNPERSYESFPARITCEWRYLTFLNYRVGRTELEPYLPAGTELDLWDGTPWMSLVALTFKNGRAAGFRVPSQGDYEQINLRFYVRRGSGATAHHGVVFLKEIVGHPLVALAARALYNERYTSYPTARKISLKGHGLQVRYAWKTEGQWNSIEGRTLQKLAPLAPDSFEEFVTQRLWSFTPQRDKRVAELRIEHPRWHYSPLEMTALDLRHPEIFGEPFEHHLRRPPDAAFLAEGSSVFVRGVTRLAPDETALSRRGLG